MTTNPLVRACAALGDAGTTALAEQLGVTIQVVTNWKTRGIPAERCPAIERATGVPCEELRPDVTWHRVPDAAWPAGRPLVDVAAELAAPEPSNAA